MARSSHKSKPAFPGAGAPHWFGDLSEAELETLRPVLEDAVRSHTEMFNCASRLYAEEMSPERAQEAARLLQLLSPEMAQLTLDLLMGGSEVFMHRIAQLGESLAGRGVPFHELLTFMVYQWRGFMRVFPQDAQSLETQELIVKWGHLRILLLVDAYARFQSAHAGARIYTLEREAGRIPLNSRTSFHGLVGATAAMHRLYARIEAAARSRSTFLILGESGTGKELVARAIHECGGPPGARFIAVNAAALPRELIESELFGYKRGAFSGALTDYPGLLRAAQGGTIFLDEIAEMAPELQGKLLRVLEQRAVRPVGAVDEVPIDVRIIASTNRVPEEAVRAGQLRQDLLYRLQKIQFYLPPLRERIEDLPLLIDHFIALFNAKLGLTTPHAGIERKALLAMRRYRWPGNVRELANAIESAVTLGSGPTIRLKDLPAEIANVSRSTQIPVPRVIKAASMEETERKATQHALKSVSGNKTAAAKLLNISRKTLYARLSRFGLS